MDNIVEYLLKSGIALSVFYFFYWLLMRKSTHFGLNRFTLAASLIASLILPFIKIDLTPAVIATSIPVMSIDLTNVVQIVSKPEPAWGLREIVLLIYFLGLAITLFRLVYQSFYIHVIAKMSKNIVRGKHTIVLVEKDIVPFAYFRKIFIPVSKMEETSFESILEHEKSHLKQYHFADLFLIEIVAIIQWFNPVVWLYERSMKELHEYMADDEVINRGVSKGNYQALLVNQALGGPVFTISHQFNQSLILKRIVMMTKMKSSNLAKVKALLFIPLTAGLLMAFSNPEPIVNPVVEKVTALTQQVAEAKLLNENLVSPNTQGTEKGKITIKGKVIDKSTSKPLQGVTVIVKGTTTGTISDVNGTFKIEFKASKLDLVFSYVGYKSIEKEFTSDGTPIIQMTKKAIEINEVTVSYLRDNQNSEIKPRPYVIIDGVPNESIDLNTIDPNTIESVSVLKDESATAMYGEKGKNGVIIIASKKEKAAGDNSIKKKSNEEVKVTGYAKPKSDEKAVFTVVEELPEFPGGEKGLMKFLSNNLQVPSEGIKEGLEGTVYVSFVVNEDGSISDAKILRGLGIIYNTEVLRVLKLMPKWNPGKQNGKPVPVLFNLPVKFTKK